MASTLGSDRIYLSTLKAVSSPVNLGVSDGLESSLLL